MGTTEYKQSAIARLEEQLKTVDELYGKGFLSSEFKNWRMNAISTIELLFGSSSSYAQTFKDIVYSLSQDSRGPALLREKTFKSGLDQAKVLISSCLEEVTNGERLTDQKTSVQFVVNLCERFYRITRELEKEYRGRKFFAIKDEYDVQHLFHGLLLTRFDDVRPEDVNPSYAGATSRVDFFIKQEKIVVEVKKTRTNLKDKEIGEQLIIDIKRYSQGPECKTLICFVYDPEQLVSNPSALENDLTGNHGSLEVIVIITPQA